MVTDYSSFYNRCVRFTILLYEHYNLSQYKFIYYFTDLYITWNIQSIYHERKKINFRFPLLITKISHRIYNFIFCEAFEILKDFSRKVLCVRVPRRIAPTLNTHKKSTAKYTCYRIFSVNKQIARYLRNRSIVGYTL